MKSPFLAFVLSFFVPGAGLWYLGWRGWAVVNLLAVIAVGVIAALALPEDVFDRNAGALSAALSGGSGGLAMTLAKNRIKLDEATRQADPGDAPERGGM
jgi:hypothetical protein